MKYLLIFWGAVYIYLILKSIGKFLRINNAIFTISEYLNSADPICDSCPRSLNKKPNYDEKLNAVLRSIPSINKSLNPYMGCEIEYMEDPITTYRKALETYKYLLRRRDFQRHDVFSSFVPTYSIKFILSFPSRIIEIFGFNPAEKMSRIINIVGWISVYVLNMYSKEIKKLINLIIDKLT